MIDVKQAIASAKSALRDFYENEVLDVRLEEVELANHEREWHITLSFVLPRADNPLVSTALSQVLGSSTGLPRYLKQLIVGSEDGHVRAMKIR